MPVNTEHDDYTDRVKDWMRVRDAMAGERAVKAAEEIYLPRPPGMTRSGRILHDGSGRTVSDDRYSHYLGFAEFPEIVGPTVDGIQGMIHEKPAEVKLPGKLDYLLEDATPDGESIAVLWERITREVTATGRLNLLHDLGSDDLVRFCTYSAEAMINWRLQPKREGGAPDLVVLREVESELDDDGFALKDVLYFRELRLTDGVYFVRRWVKRDREDASPIIDDTTDEEGWVAPILFGKSLATIPINVINAAEEGFSYGPVPIMPAVRRAFSIYRKTADYNRSLYIKTDPQPVIYGVVDDAELPDEIGGDAIWRFSNPDARAEFLDIDGLGIPLHRQAIEDDYQRFYEEIGRLRESDSGPESGEAVRRKQMVKQVTIKSLVINAGAQFEEALRHLGRTAGLGEETVRAIEFNPNLDFAEPAMPPQEYNQLVDAKLKGAPLSWKSIHRISMLRDLTDMSYEDEMAEIEKEQMDEMGRAPSIDIDQEPEAGEDEGGETQEEQEPVREPVAA